MKSRDILLQLSRRNSVIAFIAGAIAFLMTLAAVIMGILEAPSALTPERGGLVLFHLFTVNSNLVAAFGAAIIIPFAVEGIRKSRFTIPKWVLIAELSGVMGVTLTFIFALTLILPRMGLVAVSGMNLWLHVICPISAIALFYCVESRIQLTKKDVLIAMIPFCVYFIIYLITVFFIGEASSGWRDIYKMGEYLPFYISAPVMFVAGFLLTLCHSSIHNSVMKRRMDKLTAAVRSFQPEDIIDRRIEAYGLGGFMAERGDNTELTVPLELLQDICGSSDAKELEACIKAYISGYLLNTTKKSADGTKQQKRK